jgi:hypothetical protein
MILALRSLVNIYEEPRRLLGQAGWEVLDTAR